jgi:hypothetical protein
MVQKSSTKTETKAKGTQTGLSRKRIPKPDPIELEVPPSPELEIKLEPPAAVSADPANESTSRSPKGEPPKEEQAEVQTEAPRVRAATRSIVLPELAQWDEKKIARSSDPLGKWVLLFCLYNSLTIFTSDGLLVWMFKNSLFVVS